MRCDGEVGDHLLVGELVTLGALNDTIEDEDVAEGGGLEDEDILGRATFRGGGCAELEAHGLTGHCELVSWNHPSWMLG